MAENQLKKYEKRGGAEAKLTAVVLSFKIDQFKNYFNSMINDFKNSAFQRDCRRNFK